MMENLASAYSSIYSSSNPDVVKKINISSVLLSVFLLVVGGALFLIAWRQEDSSSSLSMSLLTFGTACMLWAIYRFFWKSKEWVYLPTGSTAKEGSFFFENESFNDIVNDLEDKKIDGHNNLVAKNNGNLRLDYMLSDDHKFAAVQLFKYIPYTYEPASDIFYLKGKDADDFANCVVNRKF